jgi:TonB-dependent receptor
MEEVERGGQANWSIPFGSVPLVNKLEFTGSEAKFKTGGLYKNKDRSFNMRRLYFKAPGRFQASKDSIDYSLPPEYILQDDNIGGLGQYEFLLSELTRGTDRYEARQDLKAAYLMADMAVAPRLRAVFGVRYEESKQEVITGNPYNFMSDSLVVATIEETDWLPAMNLTYALTDEVNLRLAYSQTIARPDLRELTPFSLTDFQDDYEMRGNPELERTLMRNYDFRAEYYPGLNELLALSLFYKDLTNPIEMTVQGGDQPNYSPVNGDGGSLRGIELEARLGLGRALSLLDVLSFSTNWTVTDSETKLDKLSGIQYSDTRPLQGQSPYVYNLGLFFSSPAGGTTASVLFNVFGKRLARVGYGKLPDIYEQPFHSLDMMLSQRVKGARLKLAVENLLDEEVIFEQAEFVTHSSRRGTSASFSISVGS